MRKLAAILILISSPVLAQAQPVVPVGQGPNGDWAYVARYREANQLLDAKLAAHRVVFMGDSITQGWAEQPLFRDKPSFIGRGISGQTTAQMLVRFRADVIELHPAVVHIMAGTNDVAENNGPETQAQIEGYIKSMVELAKANGIRVILGSIPPAAEFDWHKGLDPAPKIQALNRWLRAYAARNKLIYADYWSVLAGPGGAMRAEYSQDGVHPNAAGYRAMRPVAEKAVTRALRGR